MTIEIERESMTSKNVFMSCAFELRERKTVFDVIDSPDLGEETNVFRG